MMTAVSHDIDIQRNKESSGTQGTEESTDNKHEKGCLHYFRKFDDQILRPIFIYKYAKIKFKPEINFATVLKESEMKNQEIGNYIY